jgi:hypothetical protein
MWWLCGATGNACASTGGPLNQQMDGHRQQAAFRCIAATASPPSKPLVPRTVATRQVLTSLPPALLAGAEPGPSDALQLSAAGVAARVAVPLALANPPTLRCGALGALGEGGGLAQH